MQVATDNFIIEKAYLDIPSYKEKVEDEYLYQKDKDNNCIVTEYMPILDWFLIVKSKDLSVDNSFYPLTGCENTAIYGGDEHQSKLF